MHDSGVSRDAWRDAHKALIAFGSITCDGRETLGDNAHDERPGCNETGMRGSVRRKTEYAVKPAERSGCCH